MEPGMVFGKRIRHPASRAGNPGLTGQKRPNAAAAHLSGLLGSGYQPRSVMKKGDDSEALCLNPQASRRFAAWEAS